ncbi:cytochrome P450 [Amycolatopsis vancoresmycina]|uniref:Cytochrome P450 n=1 Tax=Amycolatopsis vancoresmycina DSM 44592 TaxID=1292037 RepID=R1GH50_9PSEU|nr:cytochrome P450 [Amycolatopsis vancoresmycina]EOD70577.1 cytochrome P450 [Amycolatopsis vancoresmycina DSM 44592]
MDTAEPLPYPFGDAVALEPHARFEDLRRRDGPVRVTMPYGGDAWLVTRYEQTKFVLSDPRFSRAAAAGADVPRGRPGFEPAGNLLCMDPPEHGRIRSLVAKAFTVRRVEALRPRVREIADGLLDRMVAAGPPSDFAAAVAWELPVQVICELLGVPLTDRELVRRCTETIVAVGGDVTPADVAGARDRLAACLTGLIARRKAEPADDLLTALVAARDDGDRLTDRELLMLGIALLAGGHETTASQIGSFAYQLLSQPDQWRTLAADPELVPAAVEELLRFVPLVTVADLARIATEDLELGGRPIRAGDAVLVQLDSANRDAQVFSHPAQLDFGRKANHHLAFGFGVHHCIGAPLARLELRVLFGTLVRRLPGLHLAVAAGEVEWSADRLIRGVRALPVAW